MSGTTEIRAALVSRLIAASPGAAIASASIAWENKTFAPVAGTRWYRATFLPGMANAAAIGDGAQNRHYGLMQIDVCEPKNLGDVLAANEAERIATCYKRGTVLTYTGVLVRIERVYRGAAIPSDDWYMVPILIEYRADVPN